jgi:hypothetical protein
MTDPDWSSMSALRAHYGLKSDIAPCPKSANNGSDQPTCSFPRLRGNALRLLRKSVIGSYPRIILAGQSTCGLSPPFLCGALSSGDNAVSFPA